MGAHGDHSISQFSYEKPPVKFLRRRCQNLAAWVSNICGLTVKNSATYPPNKGDFIMDNVLYEEPFDFRPYGDAIKKEGKEKDW